VNCVGVGQTTSEAVIDTFQTEVLDAIADARCFKRWQKPEDLIGAIVFFASDDSDFITGQTLVVDGGIYFN
jgi:3-oxoacyl-[acyl-carrier protein] reductase